jgi:hypothetical protein
VETPRPSRIEAASNPQLKTKFPAKQLLRRLAAQAEESLDVTIQLLDMFEVDVDLEPDADDEPGADNEPSQGWMEKSSV